MGKGPIPDDHPLNLGVSGWVGTVQANGALRNADVILAVGTRFSETDTAGWTDGAVFSIPPTRLVQVDIDPTEIARFYPVAVGIVGHAAAVMEDMLTLATSKSLPAAPDRSPWNQQIEDLRVEWAKDLAASFDPASTPIEPGRLTQELRKALPRDGIMMTDVGNSQKWIIQQFPIFEPDTFITSLGGASMGFGPGGAMGAKLAAPDKKVAVITGDGSMSMSLHILPDLVEAGLPIVYVVANDYAWASVNGPQLRRFGSDAGFFTLFEKPDGSPYYLDFSEVAKACGMQAEHVSDPEELAAAFERAFAAKGPYLIDVTIRRDTYVPMTARGAYPLPPVE
jgi:acetolactate synthase-1/2/3 large subunit